MADAEPGLADRILTKLAWTVDRSDFFDAREVAARLPPRARVIDLGCGDAALLGEFKGAGCIVVGVDPDPAAREVAAERGVTVLPGTAEDLPDDVDEGAYDLVLMTHSLEHTRDPLVALGNAYRLTRPGGLMYVELPNCGCAHFASLTKCSENFDGPRHLWFFTAKGLRHVVGQVGFEVLHYHFNGFTRHHLRSWRNWEQTIFDRLKRRGLARGARRHSLWRSLMILARSAFAPADRKYDCVGILAAKS